MGKAKRGTVPVDPVNPLEPQEAEARVVSARGRSDSANAFLPDPDDGPMRVSDDLAEMRGEDFLRGATSGEDAEEDTLDQIVPEELGGPFVETNASDEFALGTDESNPVDAEPEALPRAIHGLSGGPRH